MSEPVLKVRVMERVYPRFHLGPDRSRARTRYGHGHRNTHRFFSGATAFSAERRFCQ